MDADRRTVIVTLAAALAGCSQPTRQDRTTAPTTRPSSLPPIHDWSAGRERPDWERRADERIDRHRRSDLSLTVTRDGSPVSDAEVELTLQTHDFDFSTAYNVNRHFAVPDGHPYRQYVGTLFNEVVFENAHKWRQWVQPGAHERADQVVQFLRNRGLTLSGAPVIWQRTSEDVLPDGVWTAVETDDEDGLRSLVRDHIETILGHYVHDHGVTEWVFLNEQLGNHSITDVLSDAPPWRSPPLREWFEYAGTVAPEATLAVNEYDILALDRPRHRDRYATLVSFLLDGDVPLDEVGFQGHTLGEEERVAPREQWKRLQRFSGLGDVSLVVSEFDTPGFASDSAAGEYLYQFLKVLYSHPQAVGFRLWGYWDEQHWKGDAPLFYDDWTPKPGYHAYGSLLFDEWHTDESGTTDSNGTFRTRADLGTYRVTVRSRGAQRTVTRSLADASGETEWAIEL